MPPQKRSAVGGLADDEKDRILQMIDEEPV